MRDAADMAILDNIGSHGLSQWYWQAQIERGDGRDAYEWGRQSMCDSKAEFGYSNAVIAEIDGQVAGVAVGYLMDVASTVPDKASDLVIAPIFELFGKCDGQWVLDNLAVYSTYRKQGVGAKLLDHCFQRARKTDAKRISLVAEDENDPAILLYLSRGFEVRDKRKYVPFKKGAKTNNWVLMSAPVN